MNTPPQNLRVPSEKWMLEDYVYIQLQDEILAQLGVFCFNTGEAYFRDVAAEELYLAASCPSSRGLHLFTPDVIFLVWM